MGVDLADWPNPNSLKNRCGRILWKLVWSLLFKPSPNLLHGWRRLLLRCFGAKLGRGTKVYPSCRIWAPWNLVMMEFSNIGPDVDVYSAAQITIGAHTTISQYSYLCTATHDYEDPRNRLYTLPINILSPVGSKGTSQGRNPVPFGGRKSPTWVFRLVV